MSRDLQDFAKYFLGGFQIGSHLADRAELRSIERERNKLAAQRYANADQLARTKLGIYARVADSQVNRNNAAADKARAGGGGKGGGAGMTPGWVEGLNAVGLPPREPATPPNVTVNMPDQTVGGDLGMPSDPSED